MAKRYHTHGCNSSHSAAIVEAYEEKKKRKKQLLFGLKGIRIPFE
jgi:hypothetical protein